jgi:hypothetical protein
MEPTPALAGRFVVGVDFYRVVQTFFIFRINPAMFLDSSCFPSVKCGCFLLLPHCNFCIYGFNIRRRGDNCSGLHKILASFFCFGNGGSVLADYIVNNTNGLLTSPTIAKYWLACCAAVYFSPGDAVCVLLSWILRAYAGRVFQFFMCPQV